MNLSHRLLSSALLAGAVFSITALPLTTLGPKSVTVQLEERPVFVGQLRELASPYLALATGISLGIGAVSLALSSWRHAAHRLERSEAEITALKQQINEKNALVERLRFSDTRLQSSGLEQFIQAEEAIAFRSTSVAASTPASIPASIPQTASRFARPEIPQTVPNFDRSIVIPSKFSTAGLEFFLNDEVMPNETAPDKVLSDKVLSDEMLSDKALPEESLVSERTQPVAPRTVQPIAPNPDRAPAYSHLSHFTIQPITEPAKIEAVSSLPAAQFFKGFVRSDSGTETASVARSQLNPQTESTPQLNELLGHLKTVMTQIERLQTSQSNTPSSRNGL